MKQQGFPKAEHLKSRKQIEQLFKKGQTEKGFPLLAVYATLEIASETHQAAFSVSKKKFKHAVDRNLLKRRMREAYRLNKQLLPLEGVEKQAILFVYLPKEIQEYAQIQKGMQKALDKLSKSLQKEATQS